MKKTLTINLNNIVFHIDDDAYEMLQAYLKDVEKHLSEEEKKEVMADIEARIAEIFSESLKRDKTVINIEDVEQIITVLGKPNQYADEDDTENQGQSTQHQQHSSGEKRRSRRFYRDTENAVLGGVAAGLSSYLGWDVTWLRIALVAIVLIGWGTIIPIYVVVWLIAPKAVTVAQRLEMQGEDVTVENIKSEINNVKNYVESEKFKQQASGFGEKFAEVFRTIFKVFAGFIGAVFGFVGIVLAIALVFVLISLFFIPGLLVGFSPELASDVSMLTGDNGAILIIALLLVVGTPIFMLIYWAINLFNHRKFEHAGTTSLVTLLIWLAGIFMLYSVGAKTIVKWTKSDMHYHFNWDEFDGPTVDQARTYEAFTSIDVSNNIEVEITNDSLSQLVINAPENILDKVVTEFTDGKLKIYTDQFMINAPIKVRVSAQTLDYIEGSGASQIKTNSVLKSNNLTLKLSGASQAYLDFDVTGNTEVDLSGASKAELKGTTNFVKIDASGASKFEGEAFLANDTEADASGASKVDVFARRSLNADASGASEINCTGNPEKVKRSENMGADIRVK